MPGQVPASEQVPCLRNAIFVGTFLKRTPVTPGEKGLLPRVPAYSYKQVRCTLQDHPATRKDLPPSALEGGARRKAVGGPGLFDCWMVCVTFLTIMSELEMQGVLQVLDYEARAKCGAIFGYF